MEHFFVYGTLKKGYWNNSLLKNSKLLGNGYTTGAFYMWDVGFPFVFEDPVCSGHHPRLINGEVWEVDNPKVIADMDRLEGVGSGFYRRDKTEVRLDLTGKTMMCNIYITELCNAQSLDFSQIFSSTQRLIDATRYTWSSKT